MKKILACLLLVFSAFSLRAQKNTVFKSYIDKKEKVSIKYPPTWSRTPYSTSVFMFMRPVEKKGQKFRENVNLVVGPAEHLDIVEYLEDARKKYKDGVEGFKELRSEFIKLNGLDFARMVYVFTNNKVAFKCVLYLAVNNDKAYSLNCAALDTTFEQFYPIFQKMAESFKIW